jgi:hypothetical protein
MTVSALLAATAALEPWITLGTAAMIVVLLADRLVGGGGTGRPASLDAPLRARTERRLLVLILVVAAATRLLWWDSAVTPVFWFSEIATLYVDRWLHDGSLWPVWVRQLYATQIVGPHDSSIVLPVLAALQAMLGVRFGLPVLSGALFGTLAVLLAWAFGRRIRSPAFGLLFAALVACSPLALTWSRLSGLCIAAPAHVLLALLVGYEAGRRQSLVWAILAGAVAWTSIYEYHAARVAIPLAFAAVLAGSQRAWNVRRGVALVLVSAAAFVAIFYWLHGSTGLRALWPSYGGYAGNKGERTLAEFVSQNLDSVLMEGRNTLERYFAMRRTGWQSTVWNPGVDNGGLSLLPVGLLGMVGLFSVLRRLRRQWLWLAVAAAGFALPALSVMTARRALVFDLAWCAFAAHGLLDVADALGRRLSRTARASAVALVLGLVAVWSFGAVFGLGATMPATYGVHIPFGDAGFSDGIACRRCLEAAKGWQHDIADGAFVVLFDNDAYRENATSPGGLRTYGKIASLAAGQRDRFVELYGLMGGWESEPPAIGPIYDRMRTTFVDELVARLERAAPRRIVWHFERPTAWERVLAARLAIAGSRLETFSTALDPRGGLRVTTAWERRADALAVIEELATGLRPGDRACFTLRPSGVVPVTGPVFVLAAGDPGLERPPDWLATSWREHRYRSYRFTTPVPPIGARVSPPGAQSQQAELLGLLGGITVVEVPSLRQSPRPPLPAARTSGLNCAAWADGHWWLADVAGGRVASTHPGAAAAPRGAWIGIATTPSGELVLASADQKIVVFDPVRRTEVARFPARVPPTVRDMTDECTPIAVGADWIGIANLRTRVLSLYSHDGRDLGTRRLDQLVPVPIWFQTIGGAGRYLGVAAADTLHTFAVDVDAACLEHTTAARRRRRFTPTQDCVLGRGPSRCRAR